MAERVWCLSIGKPGWDEVAWAPQYTGRLSAADVFEEPVFTAVDEDAVEAQARAWIHDWVWAERTEGHRER